MNYFPVRCLDTYKFMIWQITAKIMTEQQLTEIKVLNSDFKTLQMQIKHSYLLLTFKFLLENSCYENMEGHHQGCLFPDISLILTALIFIWLHCLTSTSLAVLKNPAVELQWFQMWLTQICGTTHHCVNMNAAYHSSNSYNNPHVSVAV